jgi:hypothetical protein
MIIAWSVSRKKPSSHSVAYVEVIRGLVQKHQVRLAQQQPREQQAVLLPPAELLNRLVERYLAEPEPRQDLLDLMIQAKSPVQVQRMLQPVELLSQPLALAVIGRGGQRFGHPLRLVGDRQQVFQPALGLFPQRAARRELRLLGEVSQPRRRVQLDVTGIARLQPRADS